MVLIVVHPKYIYSKKIRRKNSCQIEDFGQAHLCKLCMMWYLDRASYVRVSCDLMKDVYIYKVPLRDVPRGVAQERTEKHTACDWYHTHMISYYDVMKYLCCSTCGSMHVSHSSRPADLLIAGSDNERNQLFILNRKPQQKYSADKLPHACGVASCSAGRRQACMAL